MPYRVSAKPLAKVRKWLTKRTLLAILVTSPLWILFSPFILVVLLLAGMAWGLRELELVDSE